LCTKESLKFGVKDTSKKRNRKLRNSKNLRQNSVPFCENVIIKNEKDVPEINT